MARIRSTHPGQWTDEHFVSCTPFARLLALALRNEADDHGVFEWKPVTIKMRLFPVDNVDVPALLSELAEHKQLARYEVGGREYGVIRNFCKYQRPKKPNYIHPLPDEYRTFVSLTPVSTELDDVEAASIPQKEELAPQRKEEGGRRKEEKKDSRAVAKATRPAESPFDEFWKAYPRREGANPKKPARDLFDRAVKSGVDPGAIVAGARRCAESDAKKIGTEFIPQAVKWLRDRRWEDYLPGNGHGEVTPEQRQSAREASWARMLRDEKIQGIWTHRTAKTDIPLEFIERWNSEQRCAKGTADLEGVPLAHEETKKDGAWVENADGSRSFQAGAAE